MLFEHLTDWVSGPAKLIYLLPELEDARVHPLLDALHADFRLRTAMQNM